jgi:ABC-type molybdenum transport system ATPase subunit/photorepair protein PhrA
VFAFLGPNGACKTTTVRMLVHADPPSNAACIGITCGFAVVFLALAVTGFGRPD